MLMSSRNGVSEQMLIIDWVVLSDFVEVIVKRAIAGAPSNISHAFPHSGRRLLPSSETKGEVDQLLLETNNGPSFRVLPNTEGGELGKASLNHLHMVGRGILVLWVTRVLRVLEIFWVGTVRPQWGRCTRHSNCTSTAELSLPSLRAPP